MKKIPVSLFLVFFLIFVSNAQVIDNTWRIVSGSDIVEQTAAQELKDGLAKNYRLDLPIVPSTSNSKTTKKTIYIGTSETSALIAAENAKKAFILSQKEGESYHATIRNGSLFIVGATPKGALNGVFRFLEQNTLLLKNFNLHESPAFHFRVGGHLIGQHPPLTFTEDDQARYYASHYINLIWGEKMPPPLSYEARRKYGLGVMMEVRFPPEGSAWMAKEENASAVFDLTLKNGQGRRAISPFDETGREIYLRHFRKALTENPDIKILYGAFADYNTIPDETYANVKTGEKYAYSRADGIREILNLMKEAVGQNDITIAVWMWHSFFNDSAGEKAFMIEMAEKGIGVIYNEAGNGDCWLNVRDNFIETALRSDGKGNIIYGDKYMPIVSVGGACETTGSSIALPLPAVAGYKMSKLAEAGAKNFVIWWGGVEGWTYNANMEIVAQMVWNPKIFDYKSPSLLDEPLLRQIAERDFGKQADEVLEFWKLFDKAIVWNAKSYRYAGGGGNENGLKPMDWFQRLSIYIRPYTEFGMAYKFPLIPSELSKRNELKNSKLWLYRPAADENFRNVIAGIGASLDKLAAIDTLDLTAESKTCLKDMQQWVELLNFLLQSQLNFNRACKVMLDYAGDTTALRQHLLPLTLAEIENDKNILAFIRRIDPWISISTGTSVVRYQKEPSREREVKLLEEKIAKMQQWVNPDFHGQLSVKGAALVGERGDTLVLRGVSLSWHNWWSKYYQAETVDWLAKDWKVNLIRASIAADADNGFLQNPDLAVRCLTNVVDAAIKNNIYVIIDWHTHRFLPADAKRFFTQAAEKYKDYPNVIYEIFNEPLDNATWDEVKNYSVDLINTIRAIDPKNIILVGSPHWSQDVDIVADNPILGYDNILYSFHFYAATHRNDMRKRLEYALSKQLPVFVAECGGMEAVNGGGKIDYEQWNAWLELMKRNRLSFAAWCVANKNETCSILQNTTGKIAGWSENDLSEWGNLLKTYFSN
ncbi:MAG: cellulase family glycosylhydrolase [Candidatus Symbiothrix sp.]|jgi:endoglucanase|nr:cellulase family glycosylhydrolase [Candidatus Symbiothrix sp.]